MLFNSGGSFREGGLNYRIDRPRPREVIVPDLERANQLVEAFNEVLKSWKGGHTAQEWESYLQQANHLKEDILKTLKEEACFDDQHLQDEAGILDQMIQKMVIDPLSLAERKARIDISSNIDPNLETEIQSKDPPLEDMLRFCSSFEDWLEQERLKCKSIEDFEELKKRAEARKKTILRDFKNKYGNTSTYYRDDLELEYRLRYFIDWKVDGPISLINKGNLRQVLDKSSGDERGVFSNEELTEMAAAINDYRSLVKAASEKYQDNPQVCLDILNSHKEKFFTAAEDSPHVINALKAQFEQIEFDLLPKKREIENTPWLQEVTKLVNKYPGSFLTPNSEFRRSNQELDYSQILRWAKEVVKVEEETAFYLILEKNGDQQRIAALLNAGQEQSGTVSNESIDINDINTLLANHKNKLGLVIGHTHTIGTTSRFGEVFKNTFSLGDRGSMDAVRRDKGSDSVGGFLLIGYNGPRENPNFVYERR